MDVYTVLTKYDVWKSQDLNCGRGSNWLQILCFTQYTEVSYLNVSSGVKVDLINWRLRFGVMKEVD